MTKGTPTLSRRLTALHMLSAQSARKAGNIIPLLSGATGFEPQSPGHRRSLRSNQLSYPRRVCCLVEFSLSLSLSAKREISLFFFLVYQVLLLLLSLSLVFISLSLVSISFCFGYANTRAENHTKLGYKEGSKSFHKCYLVSSPLLLSSLFVFTPVSHSHTSATKRASPFFFLLLPRTNTKNNAWQSWTR